MDIGEIERIGVRELPAVPSFPATYPKPGGAPVTPEAPPVKTPEREIEKV